MARLPIHKYPTRWVFYGIVLFGMSWSTSGTSDVLAQIVSSNQNINAFEGGISRLLNDFDSFGSALTLLGDVNGDGVQDIAVGAPGDQESAEENTGAVWILFMNVDRTVLKYQKISMFEGNFGGSLDTGYAFGSALATLGDLDGDGVAELVVGATGDSATGSQSGAVWILFLNTDGTVKKQHKIDAADAVFEGNIALGDFFGSAIASIGDINDDGFEDLAIGASGTEAFSGCVWILLLDNNGKPNKAHRITTNERGFTGRLNFDDLFGSSLTSVGDIDGDGVTELAVGAIGDDDGGTHRASDFGAVWILFLEKDGRVKQEQKISASEGGFGGELVVRDFFGSSLSALANSTSACEAELAVGATGDNDGTDGSGAVWILCLNDKGLVTGQQKISAIEGSFVPNDGNLRTLQLEDNFGSAIAPLGDWDQDGVSDLVIGAVGDNSGGLQRSGAIWMLLLDENRAVKAHSKINTDEGDFTGQLDPFSFFGSAAAAITDFDNNDVVDIAIGVPGDNERIPASGAVWVLMLNQDGTVKRHHKLGASSEKFTDQLNVGDNFGGAIANLGDLDKDGNFDIIVGAVDAGNPEGSGAIWTLFLDPTGRIERHQKIGFSEGSFLGKLDQDDGFGASISSVGDLDGDGVVDLAIGAPGDDDGEVESGAVWILFLTEDGQVKHYQKISNLEGQFMGQLDAQDAFGSSLVRLDDVNGDGVADLAVGAPGDDDGEMNSGAVWILWLDNDGAVKNHQKINANHELLVNKIDEDDNWGSSLEVIGDLNGDGIRDLVVSAIGDDDGGTSNASNNGAAYVLFLGNEASIIESQKISATEGGFTGQLDREDFFGSSLTNLGDLNADGQIELLVGAIGDSDPSVPRSGSTWLLSLNTAPVIDPSIKFMPEEPQVDSGEDVRVQTFISDLTGPITGILHVRRGGDIDYVSLFEERSQSTTFEWSIPAGLITDRGVEYFVEAIDAQGFSVKLPRQGFSSLRIAVPNLVSPSKFASEDYRLFSIPMDLERKSVSTVLFDDLGSYDATKWRFFEPKHGSPAEFSEYPDTSPFVPGKAFWLIGEGNGVFISTGKGFTNKTNTPATISLTQGWNYIGSPFTFTIPIERLSKQNGKPLNILTYEASKGGWIAPNALDPFEGYIISSSATDELFIDSSEALAETYSESISLSKTQGSSTWKISVSASTGTFLDQENEIIVDNKGREGKDELDLPEPPLTPADFLSLYFPHPDWNTPFSRYRADVRPIPKDGNVWSLNIITSVADPVKLVFEGTETVPVEYEIWLVDELLNSHQDLREKNNYSVQGPILGSPRILQVIIGKKEFSQSELEKRISLPNKYDLRPNFPNPFRKATTISFSLPENDRVTIEVYNLLGQRVTYLLNDQETPAGHHSIVWHINKQQASGIYLLRFQAGSFSATNSMVLIN